MKIKAIFTRILLGSLLIAASTLPALAEDGQDHPMVSRYPGTSIAHYDYKEFEEAQLLLSKPYTNRDGKMTADKLLPLEGQVTYIHYEVPKSISALQVFRNYQRALAQGGFKELFVCNRPCTENNLSDFKTVLKARELYLNYSRDNQYLAAQNGNAYISLFVNEGGAWLFVIEKGEMATDKISVIGNSAIAQALGKDGRVDVYGLTFDTGKATLKPGAKTTLKELGQVLSDNPQMTLDVIGHTDNAGTPESNLRLSMDRSQAVITSLNTQYGVDPARLNALGKGQSQPVAGNDNEQGKAQNRRVEFVVTSQPRAVSAALVDRTTASRNERSVSSQQSQMEQRRSEPEQKPTPSITVESVLDMATKLKSLF